MGWAETVPRAAGPRRFPDGTVSPETSEPLGRYEIVGQLGAGAMGVVYRAVDPDLRREVAIKVLKIGLGDSRDETSHRERLLREGQALAQVAHPNVVAVYDVGLCGDQVFVAMELVSGGTLRDWQRTEERTAEEIVCRYLEVAAGLAAAHRVGLVHRDVKPDNVIVGADDRVRVVDFGLAWGGPFIGEPTALGVSLAWSRLTETGVVMGTPAYVAPEQLSGLSVDDRSDQFSYCVALWEALTGELPFGARDLAQRQGIIERGESFIGQERLPRRLRDVLVRGLRYRPDDRYLSMDVLAAAIRGAVSRSKKKLAAAALMVAVAVATIAVAGFGVQRGAEVNARDLSPTSLTEIKRLEGLTNRAEELSYGGHREEAERLIDSVVDDPLLYDQPLLGPKAWQIAIEIYLQAKKPERASAMASRVIEMGERTADYKLQVLGWEQRLVTAPPTIDAAVLVEYVASARGAADRAALPRLAVGLEGLIGMIYVRRGDLKTAGASAERASSIATSTSDAETEMMAMAQLAHVGLANGRYEEVLDLTKRGLELHDRSPMASVYDRHELLSRRAVAMAAVGRDAEAEQLIEQVLGALASDARMPVEADIDYMVEMADRLAQAEQWQLIGIILDEIDSRQAELPGEPEQAPRLSAMREGLRAAQRP